MDGKNIKSKINNELVQIGHVSGLAGLILLIYNTTILFFNSTIQWRIIDSTTKQLSIISIFILLALFIRFFAQWYSKKQRMLQHSIDEHLKVNPYQTYKFTPKELLIWKLITLPNMKAVYGFTHDEGLLKAIRKLEEWVENGGIPKNDFPKELGDYYIEM